MHCHQGSLPHERVAGVFFLPALPGRDDRNVAVRDHLVQLREVVVEGILDPAMLRIGHDSDAAMGNSIRNKCNCCNFNPFNGFINFLGTAVVFS